MRRDDGVEPGLHGFETLALDIIAAGLGKRIDPADEEAQPADAEFEIETAQEADVIESAPPRASAWAG